MKSYLPFLTLAIFFASCSSVYKSGQTPDDVYFSPERPQAEYARVEKRNDRMYRNDDVTLEDHYLRMKTRNRRYTFLENDYDCLCYGSNYNSYNSYNNYYDYYRLNSYYANNSNPWMWNSGYSKYYNPYYSNAYYSPYYYNPYYANPYYSGVVYGNVYPVYNKPRKGNLNVFNNGDTYSPNNPKNNGRTINTYQSNNDNYRRSGTNAGSFLRNTFGSGNNNNSSSSNNNTSTQPSSNNSSSSSSSSSSSGGGHAPVRKF